LVASGGCRHEGTAFLTAKMRPQRHHWWTNMPMLARVRRRRQMTVWCQARRRIQQLGPYQSLILMLLPVLLVEPLKFVALFVAGKGHWLTGTGMIVGAYAASLLCVERLFRVVKPKLMMMNWFAKGWMWYVRLRSKIVGWAKGETLDTEAS
jgi:hypothetical protein